MLTQFNLKKAMFDYYGLVRLLDGKSFGASRKAINEIGVEDFTSFKDRCFYFEYKSLKGVIFQDNTGKMQINDFMYVLNGVTNSYESFYGPEHLASELNLAS